MAKLERMRARSKKLKSQFSVVGLDKYIQKLEKLGQDCDGFIRESIKAGAGYAANAIREEIKDMPANEKKRPRGGVRTYEKEALLKGLGIAPVNVFDDDFLNAKVGFAGYSDRERSGRMVHHWGFEGKHFYDTYEPGEGYIAVPVIARSIAGGARIRISYKGEAVDVDGEYFCSPNKFVRRALNNNEDIIAGVMRGTFYNEVNKVMNKK